MFVHVRLLLCQVKCAQIKACECKPSGLSALSAAFVSESLGLKMLPDDPPDKKQEACWIKIATNSSCFL